ncbi:MAG TPA: FAD/NAD(P)-binding protein [Thermoplasmata archaeon]|nr:FAD/NAD(P)-binding protein [Thermoplasmata archaeon]
MRPDEPAAILAPHPYAPAPYRVVARHAETPDTTTLVLRPVAGGAGPAVAPGQFNMVYAFGLGEVAVSVSGHDVPAGEIVHTVRSVGKISRSIGAARPGEVLGIRGPYGTGWPMAEAAGRDVLVVGGGLGLAPLRPVILELLRRRADFGRVEIIVGARTPSDLLYTGELARWRAREDLRVQVTVDSAGRDWYGDVGVVTRRLPDARFDPAKTVVFACGPEIMMRKTAEALAGLGLPESAIFLSMERNMKCAFAQCGHCQFGAAFICREGPVLSYARLRPMLAVREL